MSITEKLRGAFKRDLSGQNEDKETELQRLRRIAGGDIAPKDIEIEISDEIAMVLDESLSRRSALVYSILPLIDPQCLSELRMIETRSEILTKRMAQVHAKRRLAYLEEKARLKSSNRTSERHFSIRRK